MFNNLYEVVVKEFVSVASVEELIEFKIITVERELFKLKICWDADDV